MSEKKKAIELTLSRNGLDVVLDAKAAPEIEEFFRKASLEGENFDDDSNPSREDGMSKTSKKWLDKEGEGLEYYVKNRKLSSKVDGYRIMDNFGNGLVEGEKINVAFLRCVGISNGISIRTTDLLSFEEMKDYIERLANWTREFYEANLITNQVTATVTVEISSKEGDKVSV